MPKRLTRKLVTLFVLCLAVTAVASTPASATNSRANWYCVDMPISESCSSGYWCCDRWGNCMCA
jgi:hypothetical protein